MKDQDSRVAVWFMRYRSPEYELCDNEADAAEFTANMEYECHEFGVPDCVQFSDGRVVKIEDWPLHAQTLGILRHRMEQEAINHPYLPPSGRQVKSPIENHGGLVFVPDSDPAWIGLPA